MRLRLLPMTMVATGMLLAVKVADVVRGGKEFSHDIMVSSVDAQTISPPTIQASSASGGSASGSTGSGSTSSSSSGGESCGSSSGSGGSGGSCSSSGSGSGSSSGEQASSSGSGSTSGGESGASSSGGGKFATRVDELEKNKLKLTLSTPPTPEQTTGGKGLAPGVRYFSPIELEILQTLSKRREALDQWEKDTETKENLLTNTEKRVDEKIAEIETLKKELQAVLDKYNEQEDAKIRSLVKIYESMNPKDAARIFDELEMPILLMVIDKMSEKKAALILANMDSRKAKQVTVDLAEERRLQSTKATTKAVPLTTAPVKPGQ